MYPPYIVILHFSAPEGLYRKINRRTINLKALFRPCPYVDTPLYRSLEGNGNPCDSIRCYLYGLAIQFSPCLPFSPFFPFFALFFGLFAVFSFLLFPFYARCFMVLLNTSYELLSEI